MNKLLEIQRLAEANALKFKDCGNGHIQISGHGTMVNYWPESKKRTAHCNGNTAPNCSAWDAVRLCLTNAKSVMKPKKTTKNPPQVTLEPMTGNAAGIRHFYDGEKPPWEYPTMIQAHSDMLRIEAYQLQGEADIEDSINSKEKTQCTSNA